MKTPIRFLFTLLCAAIASFLLVLALLPPAHASTSPPGNVAAQTVPTMTIVIINNSKNYSIYPVLSTGAHGSEDKWLQAEFKIPKSQLGANLYRSTSTFRLYINPKGAGIPPGESVTITLPLYTQLVANPDPQANDQYISWWNGGRVSIYESLYSTRTPPNALRVDYMMRPSQTGVTPVDGASLPTCPTCQQPLEIFKDTGGELPSNDPDQLTEYTLGAIDETTDPYQLDKKNVDYDVSYVDNAYLPAAMEPYNYPVVGYVGTIQEINPFKHALKKFLEGKFKGWPQYVTDQNEKILKIPSALHIMLDKANLTPQPPWAPVEEMKQLWRDCTLNGGVPKGEKAEDDICAKIQAVRGLFVANYTNYTANYHTSFNGTCDQTKDPAPQMLTEEAMLAHVYGWGPFNDNCTAKTNLLQDTPGYKENNSLKYQEVKTLFDDLQYLPTGQFDPYVDLIHGENYCNAKFVYAYSVDDAVGNMQTTGEGLIIAVGGKKGLPNGRPADRPIHVNYGIHTENPVIQKEINFVQYGICTDSPDRDVNPKHASFDVFPNQLSNCTLSFVDDQDPPQKYFFKVKGSPPYPDLPNRPSLTPGPDNFNVIDCSLNTPGSKQDMWCRSIFGYTEKVIATHKTEDSKIQVGAPPSP
jgi:hypothetical protein